MPARPGHRKPAAARLCSLGAGSAQTHLTLRPFFPGVWLLEAVHLQELALFCGQLTLTDALGSLAEVSAAPCPPPGLLRAPLGGLPGMQPCPAHCTGAAAAGLSPAQRLCSLIDPTRRLQLKELSAESSDGPLTVQSAATLPPSLTKLYAVECRLAELPGQLLTWPLTWRPATPRATRRSQPQGNAPTAVAAVTSAGNLTVACWAVPGPCHLPLLHLLSTPGWLLSTSATKAPTRSPRCTCCAEAVSCLPHLESAYLSRNPLLPSSLTRLAGLPRLQLISLIGCSFERPPPELSAVTTLRVL